MRNVSVTNERSCCGTLAASIAWLRKRRGANGRGSLNEKQMVRAAGGVYHQKALGMKPLGALAIARRNQACARRQRRRALRLMAKPQMAALIMRASCLFTLHPPDFHLHPRITTAPTAVEDIDVTSGARGGQVATRPLPSSLLYTTALLLP